jgi:membrane protease YdiL (CAAX protease family)
MQISTIISTAVAYLVLVFQYKLSADRGAKDVTEVLTGTKSLLLLNKRTIQTLPLMVLSVVFYSFSNQNKFLQPRWNETPVVAVMLFLCSLISVFNGRYCCYLVKARVTKKESGGYFSLRIPSLIIYEIFFRAVLLGIFLQLFAKPVAIALNVALYGLAHGFGSRKEFVGSFPFGVLLCFVTILSQSAYPAVLLHLSLALPYESILFIKSRTN